MIGVFDSGFGGLTVLRVLAARFPQQTFLYLGDHANVPYGNRQADEVLQLTQSAVEHLFAAGCRLVILGCNTATAVAARHMQQVWLPTTHWRAEGHNVLGIIAPTVEAATQTPWAVTTPQYPQKYNEDAITVFGTSRTVSSGVYPEEILKRCPRVTVKMVACPGLVDAIEARNAEADCEEIVQRACVDAGAPQTAILGCTHFPLVEHLFRQHLPPQTRILSQPAIVAASLEDYLNRHADLAKATSLSGPQVELLTTGNPHDVSEHANVFWPDIPAFQAA